MNSSRQKRKVHSCIGQEKTQNAYHHSCRALNGIFSLHFEPGKFLGRLSGRFRDGEQLHRHDQSGKSTVLRFCGLVFSCS